MRRAFFLAVTLPVAPVIAITACATDEGGAVHGPVFEGPGTYADGAARDGARLSGDGAVIEEEDGSPGDVDAGRDAPGGCTGAVAVAGFGASGRFGARATGAGAFGVTALGTSPAGTAEGVAVAAFDGSFVAVFRGTQLAASSTGATGAWSTPVNVGAIGSSEALALAVVGTKLHLVYSGLAGGANANKYFHGSYGPAWDTADDPVINGAGGAQDFSPHGPSAAAVGTKLLIAQAGDNGKLYPHAWSGAWEPVDVSVQVDLEKGIVPRVVALDGGSAGDAMIVYVRRPTSGQDYKIAFVRRTGNNTWSGPAIVHETAYTTEGISAVALSGGRVMVAWRGTDDKPYYALWSGSAWSAPAPFFTSGQPLLATFPVLARGVCGDDAVAAFAESGVGAKVTRMKIRNLVACCRHRGGRAGRGDDAGHRQRAVRGYDDREATMTRVAIWVGAFGAVAAIAAFAACSTDDSGSPVDADGGTTDPDGSVIDDPSADGATGGEAVSECDVLTIIENRCVACHDGSRLGVPPMRSYEELMAKSKKDPSLTLAQLAVVRTKDKSMPPPPAVGPEDDEIATFEAWVKAGTPKSPTSCSVSTGGVDGGGLPDAGPGGDSGVVCTSGKYFDAGDGGESLIPPELRPLMHPGGACNTCHQLRGGPNLRVAGTVYTALREPNDCNGKGPPPPLQVILTGADGKKTTLDVNAAGNFLLERGKAPKTPFTAVVTDGTKTRAMTKPQSNTNCNSCHTVAGLNGAPGRIQAP